jgi:hypothetical protein
MLSSLAHVQNSKEISFEFIAMFKFSCTECCEENPCRGEGDSDFPALPIFDDSNFILETTAQLGGFVVNFDEGYDDYGLPQLDSSQPPPQSRSRGARAATPRALAPVTSPSKSPEQVFGSPACLYQPDPSDYLDAELVRALRGLDSYAQATLILRRLSPSWYEIDGVKCYLGCDERSRILVQEELTGMEMELRDYINQAAHVAVSLYRSKHQRAQEKRLSFNGAGGVGTPRGLHDDRLGNDRMREMEVACLQAKLREQACASPLVNAQKNASRAFAYTPLLLSGSKHVL